MINISKISIIDYVLVTLLIVLGSSHAFMGSKYFSITLAPVLFVLYIKRGGIVNSKGTVAFVLLFFFIYIRSTFSDQNLVGVVNSFLSFVCYFLIAASVKERFITTFERIMLFVCLTSLVLWSGSKLSESFYHSLLDFARGLPQFDNTIDMWENDTRPSVSMYLFEIPKDISMDYRNAGPFYEPGRLAAMILIAMVFEMYRNGRKLISKNMVLFMLTLLSTMSTMGYVGLIVILVGYVLVSNMGKFPKFVLAVVFVFLVNFIFTLDFMGDKIADNMIRDDSLSRFGAMAYHWAFIMKSPIFGTTFLDLGSPNGLTHIIAVWGIPFSMLYYVLLYRGSRNLFISSDTKYMGIILFFVLLVNAFAQTITESALYFTIASFGVVYSTQD